MRDIECGFTVAGKAINCQHLVIRGPVIDVQIGYDPHFDIDKINVTGLPKLGQQIYNALIDTGATASCVDKSLATSLGLQIVDRQSSVGIGGVQEFDLYLAQIYIPRLGWGTHGSFQGVHLSDKNGNVPYHAILGRTFLTDFRMVYDGWTGSVKLTSALAIPPQKNQNPEKKPKQKLVL